MHLSFENNASISLKSTIKQDSDDFWAEMFDRPVVKYGLTSFTTFTLVLLTPYVYISLMFIQKKHFRTIVTYGEAMICFFLLLCLIVLIAPAGLRIILGPLSSTMCWWQIFFNQCLSVNFMLVFCANYLARYFYVVVYKTATICNDDFIGFFIFIQTLMMGFVFALMHNMCYGKFALNYYVCQGKNPELDPIEREKFTVTVLLAGVTLTIFALTNYKIYQAKKKCTQRYEKYQALVSLLIVPYRYQQPSQGLEASLILQSLNKEKYSTWCKRFFSERFFPMVTKLAWSSVDLMTIWMMVILITSDAILWNGYIKKLTVEEIKTTGWGHFGYLYHTHLFPQFGLWSFAISTFVRKPNLRKHLLETIGLK